MQKQIAAWGLVVMISAGLGAAGALRAAASTNGRRNTTIVLGAATVGERHLAHREQVLAAKQTGDSASDFGRDRRGIGEAQRIGQAGHAPT